MNHGSKMTLDTKEEIDYEVLKSNLNMYLKTDNEITAQDIIILHRESDDLLTFLFLIAIGLNLHLVTPEEANQFMVNTPRTVMNPVAYNRHKEQFPESAATVDITISDERYQFASGVQTIFPKDLLKEIKNLLKDLHKKNKTIIPPPLGRTGKTRDGQEESKKDTPIARLLRSMSKNSSSKIPQSILSQYPLRRKKTTGNSESIMTQETSYMESAESDPNSRQEITNGKGPQEKNNQDEGIEDTTSTSFLGFPEKLPITSTPKGNKAPLYPDLSTINKDTPDLEQELKEFNSERLVRISGEELKTIVKDTKLALPKILKPVDEFSASFEYYRNRIVSEKYLSQVPAVIDLIEKLTDETLKKTLKDVISIIDNIIKQVLARNPYSTAQREFDHPPLMLREDPLITLIILPNISKEARVKLCRLMEWTELIIDMHCYNINNPKSPENRNINCIDRGRYEEEKPTYTAPITPDGKRAKHDCIDKPKNKEGKSVRIAPVTTDGEQKICNCTDKLENREGKSAYIAPLDAGRRRVRCGTNGHRESDNESTSSDEEDEHEKNIKEEIKEILRKHKERRNNAPNRQEDTRENTDAETRAEQI